MALCNRCSSDFRISNLVPIDAMRGHYRLRHQFCQGSRLVDDMALYWIIHVVDRL